MTSTASSTVHRPTSVDEAAVVLRDSRGGVLFRGAGTKMSWAGRPHDPDLVLETTGLDQLLDHNPSDMTASRKPACLCAPYRTGWARQGSGLRSTQPRERHPDRLGVPGEPRQPAPAPSRPDTPPPQ